MKQIKINHISMPDKSSVFTDRLHYTVNLGNGIVKKFLNKAEAQRFLNEVSKYLTYKLHECNELYISTFTYYRRAWFYFDHNKPTGNVHDLYVNDRLCKDNLTAVGETFELLYKRANWANGNHFVFVHYNTILNNLIQVTGILEHLYSTKSAGALQYELEILKTKLIYCKRTIDNYTIELENSFKESEIIPVAKLKIV